jgi:FAD binding domain-containing protein/berberine-like enzyme
MSISLTGLRKGKVSRMTQGGDGTGQQGLSGAAVEGSTDMLGETGMAVGAGLAGTADAGGHPAFGPVAITPADQQYPDLISGMNQRFIGKPEAVQLVDSTSQVVKIVDQAVSRGKRITVRSGGHCFEDFVFNPSVQVVLDVSKLNRIYFDSARNAVAVEPGATLLSVYEMLYEVWGVTIPGGICYSVGIGGHVSGGGWGLLCRQHGLISDHLYAVEVVVVDAAAKVHTVVATREDNDPNRDLWWAHTGGGGGNFGIVTRYWFRSPGTTGHTPSTLLPKPPAEVLLNAISFPWSAITQKKFIALVQNYAVFHANNSTPATTYTAFGSFLVLNHQSNGQIVLITQIDAGAPNAEGLLDDYLTAVTKDVEVEHQPFTAEMSEYNPMPEFFTPRRLPWLHAVRYLGTNNSMLNDPTLRADYKSAYMRTKFPDHQLATLYKHLTRTDFSNPFASVTLSSFGGNVNTVAQNATASAHRDSAFKLLWMVMWNTTVDDGKNLDWIRKFYREMYVDTGGVPVPNTVTDGCYINYADIDLSDPEFNKSRAPWYQLYYKENYPRLQKVKARWDPRNIFRHGQSIQLPSA